MTISCLCAMLVCASAAAAPACSSGSGEPHPAVQTTAPATGPLKIHPLNQRYFSDGSGKAIYLTGSHTWSNFQDRGATSPPSAFDYPAYLQFLERHGHNFIRLWVHEQARWSPWGPHRDYFNWPLPYWRTGPGRALDGGQKFDLTKFDQTFFDRLRSRVREAQARGIYVSIMLFDGWSIEKKRPWGIADNPWKGHPFNRENNINGIDGDLNGDGEGPEVHTLQNPTITALQEAYVGKVIDTVNDLDNVLYEIANESAKTSVPWQLHMIDVIYSYEARKPKQHAVWFTAAWGHDGSELWASRAEAIAPGWPSADAKFVPYRDDPPANDGKKVVINDTDHMWGIGGTREWVWKNFVRGLNPIYMDPYDESRERWDFQAARPTRQDVLQAMEYTRTYANRIGLVGMAPRNDLCSTRYCMANPGKEYLLYLPSPYHRGLGRMDQLHLHGAVRWVTRAIGLNETVTVDLTPVSGGVAVEWFNPRTGETTVGKAVSGGGHRSFTAPFTGDAVLYISAGAQLSLGPGVERVKPFSSSARGCTDEKAAGHGNHGRGWNWERTSVA